MVINSLSEEEKSDSDYKAIMASYVFIALGLGDFVTGFILGKVRQSYSSYTLGIFCIQATGFAFFLGMVQYFTQSYILCIVIGGLLG